MTIVHIVQFEEFTKIDPQTIQEPKLQKHGHAPTQLPLEMHSTALVYPWPILETPD